MECAYTNNREFLEAFDHELTEKRVPFMGSIELTHRCNLRCLHCYLGNKRWTKEEGRDELTTEQWIRRLDEITTAGCLLLLITGGEPFLRKDFYDIYSHAKLNGMIVTVFTNGTLITDQTVEQFKDLPPDAVEITVYGATAETNDRIADQRAPLNNALKESIDSWIMISGLPLKRSS